MQMTPIDFEKVESLRKHMLLTASDISAILGISRMTYYGWVKGKPIRRNNDMSVRLALKKLLAIMSEHQWPQPSIIGLPQKQRMQKLLELLETYN
jgi:DNA-binding XRE family transcriptional regulator